MHVYVDADSIWNEFILEEIYITVEQAVFTCRPGLKI